MSWILEFFQRMTNSVAALQQVIRQLLAGRQLIAMDMELTLLELSVAQLTESQRAQRLSQSES